MAKKMKKLLAIVTVSLSVFMLSAPVYAASPSESQTKAMNTFSDYSSALLYNTEALVVKPACPRCKTNQWVVPIGLVAWNCMKCGWNWM